MQAGPVNGSAVVNGDTGKQSVGEVLDRWKVLIMSSREALDDRRHNWKMPNRV